jgi:hypothetical protein
MGWDPTFKRLLKSFNAEQVRYLLVGGYAVILHGYPRSTIDLDLWVEPSEDNARSIDGLEVPVIDLASLRITKKASGRLQDLADLERLPE